MQEFPTGQESEEFHEVVKGLAAFFGAGAVKKGGRATHTQGVAARGRFQQTIASFEETPFAKGNSCSVKVRHSTVGGRGDDAAKDARGMSISLEQADGTPFDLLLNTSRVFLARNPKDFLEYVSAFLTPAEMMAKQELMFNDGRISKEAITEGYRQPERFQELFYHSQIAYETPYGELVRFRTRAQDQEGGLMPEGFDSQGVPLHPRTPGDARPEDFLRQRFTSDLKDGPIVYRLECQRRLPKQPQDREAMLDCTVPWDETWEELGTLTLEEPTDLEGHHFSLAHNSPGMRIPTSSAPDENAALAHSRILIYRQVGALRP
jgi:hypothetical protein